MERDARRRAEALDRFWDDLLSDSAAEQPPDVDEVYAATMRRVNALGDVPGLTPARNRIWQSLSQQRRPTTASAVTMDGFPDDKASPGMNGHRAHLPVWRRLPAPPNALPRHRWAFAPWAMATLLVLAMVGLVITFAQPRARPETVMMSAPLFYGRFESLWQVTGGVEPLVYPQGLAVDPQGNVWVVDGGNARFQIFAPDGTFLETWGTSGSAPGEFNFAVPEGIAAERGAGFRGDIAFDAAGNIYVADSGNHRIQVLASDRTFLRAWGSEGEGEGQFITPMKVAVGLDGSVYVCDEDRRDIQKFDAQGQFQGVFGAYELDDGKPSEASSVAVDGAGFVWVADQANQRIARFSPDGTFQGAWGVRGTRPGELFHPLDLAIDEVGLIYVIDRFVHRIQIFSPDGRFLAEQRSDTDRRVALAPPQAIAVGRDGLVYLSTDVAIHAFHVIERVGDAMLP